MSLARIKTAAVFEAVAPHLQAAAKKALGCKGTVDQFAALASALDGLGGVLAEADKAAHSGWTDSVARHSGALSGAIEVLGNAERDADLTAAAMEKTVAALHGLSGTLIAGAGGLVVRDDKAARDPEVASAVADAVDAMTETAFEISAVADLFREAAGHWPGDLPTPLVYPRRSCCGGCHHKMPVDEEMPVIDIAAMEDAIDRDEALRLALGRAEDIPERIARVLELLAALFILLSAMTVSLSCAAECTAARDSYIGNRIARIYAPLVATRTYQPTMDVDWQWCCWNWCWIFWWDKYLTTVTTTVTLGGLFVLGPGRPTGTAMTVARQRARAFNLATLARPANPC